MNRDTPGGGSVFRVVVYNWRDVKEGAVIGVASSCRSSKWRDLSCVISTSLSLPLSLSSSSVRVLGRRIAYTNFLFIIPPSFTSLAWGNNPFVTISLDKNPWLLVLTSISTLITILINENTINSSSSSHTTSSSRIFSGNNPCRSRPNVHFKVLTWRASSGWARICLMNRYWDLRIR